MYTHTYTRTVHVLMPLELHAHVCMALYTQNVLIAREYGTKMHSHLHTHTLQLSQCIHTHPPNALTCTPNAHNTPQYTPHNTPPIHTSQYTPTHTQYTHPPNIHTLPIYIPSQCTPTHIPTSRPCPGGDPEANLPAHVPGSGLDWSEALLGGHDEPAS